jgi:hypothetical protein
VGDFWHFAQSLLVDAAGLAGEVVFARSKRVLVGADTSWWTSGPPISVSLLSGSPNSLDCDLIARR